MASFLIPLVIFGGGAALLAASSGASVSKKPNPKTLTDKQNFPDEPYIGEAVTDPDDGATAVNLHGQVGILRALLRHKIAATEVVGVGDAARWETDVAYAGPGYVDPGSRALQFVVQALLDGRDVYVPLAYVAGGTVRPLPSLGAGVRGIVAVKPGYKWDPMKLSYYARLMRAGVPRDKIEFLGKSPGSEVEADLASHDV